VILARRATSMMDVSTAKKDIGTLELAVSRSHGE
jgi:hypothetical protein